jgi:hypothetical protein
MAVTKTYPEYLGDINILSLFRLVTNYNPNYNSMPDIVKQFWRCAVHRGCGVRCQQAVRSSGDRAEHDG